MKGKGCQPGRVCVCGGEGEGQGSGWRGVGFWEERQRKGYEPGRVGGGGGGGQGRRGGRGRIL